MLDSAADLPHDAAMASQHSLRSPARLSGFLLLWLCACSQVVPAEADDEPALPRAASPLVDDAQIVAVDLPATLSCATTYRATVTVRNSGSATWSRPAGYKLGAVDDSDPFYGPDTRVWLPDGVSVAAGATYTFSFDLIAPAAAGRYVTDWRMVHEGVRWFGATTRREVSVRCVPAVVDATTLERKLLMGYQGWFACAGDGSPVGGWVHWFRSSPACASLTVDLWPDVSELAPGELCATGMTRPDGSPAPLYSAFNADTVARHFLWQKEQGIDGVLLQRFTSELSDPRFFALRNQVARNVRAGAEAHGRAFALMYDISGHPAATLVDDIKRDWIYVVDTLGLPSSPRYLQHAGKPVLGLWGLGVRDRPGDPAQAQALISFFKNHPDPRYRATLIGGVPQRWRTLDGDSKTDAAWAGVYRSFDIISPWAVGAYADDAGADRFKSGTVAPDLAAARAAHAGYMPVIFPGFSWHNLLGGPSNQIPRRGGRFFWRQAYNVISAGSSMIFVAMFDEVDEGTAMMKLAPAPAALPAGCALVPLNIDGENLPSDFYLRVAGEATRMLHGESALTPTLPIAPFAP